MQRKYYAKPSVGAIRANQSRIVSSEGGTVDGLTSYEIAMDMWAAVPESLKSPSKDTVMHDQLSRLLERHFYSLRPDADIFPES